MRVRIRKLSSQPPPSSVHVLLAERSALCKSDIQRLEKRIAACRALARGDGTYSTVQCCCSRSDFQLRFSVLSAVYTPRNGMMTFAGRSAWSSTLVPLAETNNYRQHLLVGILRPRYVKVTQSCACTTMAAGVERLLVTTRRSAWSAIKLSPTSVRYEITILVAKRSLKASLSFRLCLQSSAPGLLRFLLRARYLSARAHCPVHRALFVCTAHSPRLS